MAYLEGGNTPTENHNDEPTLSEQTRAEISAHLDALMEQLVPDLQKNYGGKSLDIKLETRGRIRLLVMPLSFNKSKN